MMTIFELLSDSSPEEAAKALMSDDYFGSWVEDFVRRLDRDLELELSLEHIQDNVRFLPLYNKCKLPDVTPEAIRCLKKNKLQRAFVLIGLKTCDWNAVKDLVIDRLNRLCNYKNYSEGRLNFLLYEALESLKERGLLVDVWSSLDTRVQKSLAKLVQILKIEVPILVHEYIRRLR